MISSLAIVAFAALIHASFQLSVSVLTLLGSHAIGRKVTPGSLLRLTCSFMVGVAVMTILILSFAAYSLQQILDGSVPPLVWAISCGLLLGLGVSVWAFYYRREAGTSLWLPRGMARFLSDRTKATRHSSEAFSLGMTSVIAELLFISAPVLVSALVLINLDPLVQLAGVGLYGFISLLSIIIVWMLISSGHKLSRIQKWREDNKRFLQFAAGSGLLILGFYIYVSEVMTASTLTAGGFQ